MKLFKRAVLISVAAVLMMAMPVLASADKPGEGVTVSPARATWDTGFFQEAVVRKGLEALGYKVKKPKDLLKVPGITKEVYDKLDPQIGSEGDLYCVPKPGSEDDDDEDDDEEPVLSPSKC